MKQRLLLIIALAVLAAATVGTVSAQGDDPLGSGTDQVTIDLPGGSDLPDVGGALPACANTQDDDGDGAVDLGDPGCSGPTDTSEEDPGGATTTDPGTTGTTGTTGTAPPTAPTAPGTGPAAPAGGGGGGAGGGGGGAGGDGGGTGGAQAPGDDGGPREPIEEPDIRDPDGTPTNANPGLTIADYGPAPVGISTGIIRDYEIPPFLLPIFNACGTQYSIPWNVLASIMKIESYWGTNMGPSSAGAIGPMQFLPSTWKAYGVDANGDDVKDPYNFVDSVCGAARYLNASGGEEDLQRALFAYNHAQWYVDEVLLVARQYGELPAGLIGSLTGLTEGAHFPVAADARYADDVAEREVLQRASTTPDGYEEAAEALQSSPTRNGINIYPEEDEENAPVVAVNDGEIKEIGQSDRLGNYIVLSDAWGNEFTYAELGSIADAYPVPQRQKLSAADFELVSPRDDQAPDKPASDPSVAATEPAPDQGGESEGTPTLNTEDLRPRLYAYPERPRNVDNANLTGQLDELLDERFPAYETFKSYFGGVLRFDRETMEMKPLQEGSRVVAGTVLGQTGKTDELAEHVHFKITPAGRKSEPIDPKPILDGWKLLEATAIYRARGENPFEDGVDVSSILLMSKTELERYVLDEPRIEIYECGREDIQTHQIDRRVLVTMGVLAARGFRLGVTSLKCGHSFYTSSGGVSHHSSGNAVDIAQVNGMPILGNQGRGSITEAVLQELLAMQEPYQCDQLISLMDLGGPTFAMSDHADHIHCGFTPTYQPGESDKQFDAVLDADQWQLLIDQVAQIDNPQVKKGPSEYAIPAKQRASDAHLGE